MSVYAGIDHIEFNVENIDESVAFFKKLGFVETRRTAHTGGSVELRFPGDANAPIFELNSSTKEPKGFQHIAIRCNDIDTAFAEVSAQEGVKILRPLGPPRPESGRRVFNVEDPDGFKVQFSTKID